MSQIKPWDHLFGDLGVRWLHTGGIFAALSESAAATVIEAVTAARRHGTTPGDTTMATKAEALKLAAGGSARVDR